MIRADRPTVDRAGLERLHGLSRSQANRRQPWNSDGHPAPINNPPSRGRLSPLWDEEQVRAFVAGDPIPDLPTIDAGNDLLAIDEFAAILGVKPNTVHKYVDSGHAPPPDRTINGHGYWYRDTISGYQASRPGKGAGAGRRAGPDHLSSAELRRRAEPIIAAAQAQGTTLMARTLARELEVSPTTASKILREAGVWPAPGDDRQA